MYSKLFNFFGLVGYFRRAALAAMPANRHIYPNLSDDGIVRSNPELYPPNWEMN